MQNAKTLREWTERVSSEEKVESLADVRSHVSFVNHLKGDPIAFINEKRENTRVYEVHRGDVVFFTDSAEVLKGLSSTVFPLNQLVEDLRLASSFAAEGAVVYLWSRHKPVYHLRVITVTDGNPKEEGVLRITPRLQEDTYEVSIIK